MAEHPRDRGDLESAVRELKAKLLPEIQVPGSGVLLAGCSSATLSMSSTCGSIRSWWRRASVFPEHGQTHDLKLVESEPRRPESSSDVSTSRAGEVRQRRGLVPGRLAAPVTADHGRTGCQVRSVSRAAYRSMVGGARTTGGASPAAEIDTGEYTYVGIVV